MNTQKGSSVIGIIAIIAIAVMAGIFIENKMDIISSDIDEPAQIQMIKDDKMMMEKGDDHMMMEDKMMEKGDDHMMMDKGDDHDHEDGDDHMMEKEY